jgi:hypothetical protein
MITQYFKPTKSSSIIHEYFELHRAFIPPQQFKAVHEEVKPHIRKGQGSRLSCVCVSREHRSDFTIYSLPLIDWTPQIDQIRQSILKSRPKAEGQIDYGLVHYYHDESSVINWHYDREAMKTTIYSISLGNPRRFCLRNKETKELHTFDLYDGDLFIMKIGCQERFEHCIKSIKTFNQPRISITFRQIEKPMCYAIYNPSTYTMDVAGEIEGNDLYHHVVTTPQGIHLVYVKGGECDTERFEPLSTTLEHLSLLKSNLQKAIRRQEKEVALHTALKFIYHGQWVELLRRLTIITFEDVTLNRYYPAIVWLYVAISSRIYHPTHHDIIFIYSYVGYLCELNEATGCDFSYKGVMPFHEICEHPTAVALYLRLQYGGFDGELCAINDMMFKVIYGDIQIAQQEMTVLEPYELAMVTILDCAIDFHCFPSMVKRIQARIPGTTEDEIRQAIWEFDSSVNVRLTVNHHTEQEKKWIEKVQPECRAYRTYLRNRIE